MTWDAAVVLGSGIDKAGNIPASSIAAVEKAVELLRAGRVRNVVFAGRWSYRLDYIPPKTEARAMADYAIVLGAGEEQIFLEEQSSTTVSNLCLVKENILIPNKFRTVALVVSGVHQKRAEYNLKKVLGAEYKYQVVASDFGYPREIERQVVVNEKAKLKEAINFYKGLPDGDHQAILKAAVEDLKTNYATQK